MWRIETFFFFRASFFFVWSDGGGGGAARQPLRGRPGDPSGAPTDPPRSPGDHGTGLGLGHARGPDAASPTVGPRRDFKTLTWATCARPPATAPAGRVWGAVPDGEQAIGVARVCRTTAPDELHRQRHPQAAAPAAATWDCGPTRREKRGQGGWRAWSATQPRRHVRRQGREVAPTSVSAPRWPPGGPAGPRRATARGPGQHH